MKTILITLLTFTVTMVVLGFNLLTSDAQILEKAPEFYKGTFWKGKNEQLTTYTGQKANNTTISSCYIDKVVNYKGSAVYEATFLVHEENKIIKFFINKENLKIQDAIGMFSNYRFDTLVIEYELLNFPLYKGKSWENISKYQEFPQKPITFYNSKFKVNDIRDTLIYISGKKIKTEAFHLTGVLSAEKDTFFNNYIYLAPSREFPGSCPIFLWNQFFKGLKSKRNSDNKMTWRFTITDFNWQH